MPLCPHHSEWVCRGLMSHLTLHSSFRGQFLQVRWPNKQSQSTERSQLATEISFNHTRTTPPCYNMNCRQPPLGYWQHKGPSVTKTQSAGPISCLEHRATRVLHCTIVTTAAMLMFHLLLQSVISSQKRARRLRGGPHHKYKTNEILISYITGPSTVNFNFRFREF